MARDPQKPVDEEIERAERDGEPQPTQAPLEGDLDAVADELEHEPGENGGDANPEAEVLAARVEELEQALTEAKDQSMRAAAEAQNARRRAEQDAEKARKFALEKFVKELLPVVDSLEKGLESMQEVDETHREGVSMTLKMQLDALAKFGVEQIDPQGEPFDPQFHEAMSMVPNPELDPNTVMDVMQKGYTLNGRLVRPAMVIVSKSA
ncbi:nucleotide exchange factor GrpE [Salinicola endophyticus]|uniref:Protein GrpE n=1 Tax=Salinicola endophyticus TaxID=1949083 RepID=A0ABY8FDS4_9GAMM|nr:MULTISPECIES: nucleotide exchange factor GrpE [Salinicola]WFF40951.1 nucleotide exchange factor GrpE [Salinicola endophyticus]